MIHAIQRQGGPPTPSQRGDAAMEGKEPREGKRTGPCCEPENQDVSQGQGEGQCKEIQDRSVVSLRRMRSPNAVTATGVHEVRERKFGDELEGGRVPHRQRISHGKGARTSTGHAARIRPRTHTRYGGSDWPSLVSGREGSSYQRRQDGQSPGKSGTMDTISPGGAKVVGRAFVGARNNRSLWLAEEGW